VRSSILVGAIAILVGAIDDYCRCDQWSWSVLWAILVSAISDLGPCDRRSLSVRSAIIIGAIVILGGVIGAIANLAGACDFEVRG